ncbi:MAG: dihydrofolate reductase [Bacillota bacterium]|nr:dihydrofolate reductase [Bacillota bacterium]
MELIVAVDKNWGIGKGNELLVHLPGDLKRVKEITMGHALILGKKTLESFPGGNPLPGRPHIVLCFPDEKIDKDVIVVNSIEEAVKKASLYDRSFVFGGESVYRSMLPYCTKAYVTKIDYAFDADRFFPNLDEDESWKVKDIGETNTYNDINYTYLIYERIK